MGRTGATVADAATCALVDVAAGSSPAEAARAFAEAAACWHDLARVRTVFAEGAARPLRH